MVADLGRRRHREKVAASIDKDKLPGRSKLLSQGGDQVKARVPPWSRPNLELDQSSLSECTHLIFDVHQIGRPNSCAWNPHSHGGISWGANPCTKARGQDRHFNFEFARRDRDIQGYPRRFLSIFFLASDDHVYSWPLSSNIGPVCPATAQAVANLALRIGVGELAEQHGDQLSPAARAFGAPFRFVFLDQRRELGLRNCWSS
jgi:hypothetical protein